MLDGDPPELDISTESQDERVNDSIQHKENLHLRWCINAKHWESSLVLPLNGNLLIEERNGGFFVHRVLPEDVSDYFLVSNWNSSESAGNGKPQLFRSFFSH